MFRITKKKHTEDHIKKNEYNSTIQMQTGNILRTKMFFFTLILGVGRFLGGLSVLRNLSSDKWEAENDNLKNVLVRHLPCRKHP